MASRKYLKFGLRADRNLADLSDSTLAVDNLLNNLASGSNAFGESYNFTSADISPIRQLSSTDLIDIVDPDDGLPKILTDLEASVPVYSASEVSDDPLTGTQLVQPQVTLQDYINRFKVVLGDPPFINGGSGPFTEYVHPSRITNITGDINNFTINLTPSTNAINDLVVGNRYKILTKGNITNAQWDSIAVVNAGTYNAGDVFVCDQTVATVVGANTTAIVRDVSTPTGNYALSASAVPTQNLPSDVLFTKISGGTLPNIIQTSNDWDVGRFQWDGALHNSFNVNDGLVQFTGYQVSNFFPPISTNGLFLVEEDVVDTANDDTNWRFIRGTNTSTVIPTYNITWLTNSDGYTEITFTNREDWRKVGVNMTASLNGADAGQVTEIKTDGGVYRVCLSVDFGTTESSGTTVAEFSFEVGGETLIEYAQLDFTQPPGDFRRKVRYTCWWPTGTVAGAKIFGKPEGSVYEFGSLNFYKEQVDSTFINQRYSYPYFRDNRANILKQDGNTEVRVDNKFLNVYQKPGVTKDILQNLSVFPDTVASSYNTITAKIVSAKSDGSINGTNDFTTAEVGDFIVSSRHDGSNQLHYVHQIKQKVDSSKVYVDSTYLTITGIAADTDHNIVLVKNNGLIGIYKSVDATGTNTLAIQRTQEGIKAKYPFEVEEDCIIYKVDDGPFGPSNTDSTHSTHRYGFRVRSTTHNNDRAAVTGNLTVDANPTDSSATVSTNGGFVVVYSSKGLMDRSTTEECTSVFGREVTATALASQNEIVVNDVTGITVGDLVYFDGAIPYDNTSVTTMTRVKAINGSTIQLGKGSPSPTTNVNLSALLSIGSTVVFVPVSAGPNSDGWGLNNKEYCIIPLNTAPPWEGTDLGLASPAKTATENFGVMSKEFRFVKLSFELPTANITKYTENDNDKKKYLNVKFVPPTS
jgi:hypothetical protein